MPKNNWSTIKINNLTIRYNYYTHKWNVFSPDGTLLLSTKQKGWAVFFATVTHTYQKHSVTPNNKVKEP